MRYLYIAILAVAFSSASFAQSPEFILRMHFHDAHGGHGPDSLGFGFDPNATDSLDPQFGEFEYPAAIAPGGNYTAFDLHKALGPDDTLFSGIDILPKPKSNSFSISYTFYASAYNFPGTLWWNRTSIPEAINAIRIIGGDGTVFADMLQQDSVQVKIQDYQAWFPASIVLYYNQTPPPLGVGPAQGRAALLSNIATYPNPIREFGKVALTVVEPSVVTLTGFDETGRECIHQVESVSNGMSVIPLREIGALHGSILLHVEALSATRTESRNILVVKD